VAILHLNELIAEPTMLVVSKRSHKSKWKRVGERGRP